MQNSALLLVSMQKETMIINCLQSTVAWPSPLFVTIFASANWSGHRHVLRFYPACKYCFIHSQVRIKTIDIWSEEDGVGGDISDGVGGGNDGGGAGDGGAGDGGGGSGAWELSLVLLPELPYPSAVVPVHRPPRGFGPQLGQSPRPTLDLQKFQWQQMNL